MLFLTPNQHCRKTEGVISSSITIMLLTEGAMLSSCWLSDVTTTVYVSKSEFIILNLYQLSLSTFSLVYLLPIRNDDTICNTLVDFQSHTLKHVLA